MIGRSMATADYIVFIWGQIHLLHCDYVNLQVV